MYASLNLAHSRDCYEVLQTPYMICDPGRHRRGDPQRAMHAAEVVIGEVQRDSRLQAAELLREGQRQPVQSLQGQPHSQVVALDIRGTDTASRWSASDCRDLNAAHLRRPVSSWSRIVSRVGLNQRGVIHIIPEGLLNGFKIGPE